MKNQVKSKGSIKDNPKGKSTPAKKIKTRKKRIQSREFYELTMKEIDALMKKGEGNLSQKELKRFRILAEAAENYEDTYEPLPVPS